MNLGEKIYQLRTKHNLSQEDLAQALNVSRQSVSKWENNSAVPELDKMVKMSGIFGITLDEMVTGKKPEAAPSAPPEAAGIRPAQPETKTVTLREIFGVVLICLAVILLIASLLFSEDFLEAGIYFTLILATSGTACCWPAKLAVHICIYALDALFLLLLAFSGSMQSAGILSIPFIIIFIAQVYHSPRE